MPIHIVLLLHTDIENLQQFIKNFGAIGKLMIIGYSLVWVTITEILNCLIRFIFLNCKYKWDSFLK
ncbi:hypothetical protein [Spiroplasma endosymbiont of Lonchoptera lutea]|uniref:hypothetical protein n=1 Tax=Spiroplasma endosymbiont of Lonchoptera lutea TaxID=3066297 RepID=UPI0030D108BB